MQLTATAAKGAGVARQEQALERDGSPTRELAYWLRDARRQSGLTVDQLKSRTQFSSTTLYDAFAGRQLPSQRVTLAIAASCGGDVEAWRSYWGQVRRTLDRDAPPGLNAAIIPPWAPPELPPGSPGEGDPVELRDLSALAIETDDDPQAPARPGDHDKPTGPRLADGRPHRLTWPVAVAGMAVVAAASAIITAFAVGRSPSLASSRKQTTPPLAVVVIQNKDAIGPSSLLEDGTPAYLSLKPIPRCRLQGCEVDGTNMSSGADLVVTCWVRGVEMTNENTTTAGIAQNPGGATSTLWYRGVWPNGRSGYLSDVYIAPRYRGGLGLPKCK